MKESTLSYCNNLFLGITNTAVSRFQQVQDRAFNIVHGKNYILNCWCPITNVREQRCAQEVFKCLNGLICQKNVEENLKRSHHRETRGNNSKLRLPKVKTKSGRKMLAIL